MLNLIFKMQNLSDFSYFLLNIRKVLVNWNFLAHFYASNFVNRLFLQRSPAIFPQTNRFPKHQRSGDTQGSRWVEPPAEKNTWLRNAKCFILKSVPTTGTLVLHLKSESKVVWTTNRPLWLDGLSNFGGGSGFRRPFAFWLWLHIVD